MKLKNPFEWVKKVDDFLFDRIFEPFAHWTQKEVGLNNFHLTRICCFLVAVLVMLVGAYKGLHVGIALTGIIIPAIFTLIILPTVERQVPQTTGFGFRNHYREWNLMFFIRIAALILGMCNEIQGVVDNDPELTSPIPHLLFLFEIMLLYFLCCTPLPPGKSKFKKWLESLSAKPATT